MSEAHEKVVEAQFGPRAQAYVDSEVHEKGPDLEALEAVVRQASPRRALDLGAGGGHVSYLLARHAQQVTALDLSSEMLAAVAANARTKQINNIDTQQAPAEDLPFEDARFDFLGCRYSAHHWRDFDGGLREARRILQRGAPAVFIDIYSSGLPLFDTHLQAIELLRDTSHVRDYSAAEWGAALERSGFLVKATRTWRLRMDFSTWIARMQTPEHLVVAIRALQAAASAEVKDHFGIEEDGSFMADVLMLETAAA